MLGSSLSTASRCECSPSHLYGGMCHQLRAGSLHGRLDRAVDCWLTPSVSLCNRRRPTPRRSSRRFRLVPGLPLPQLHKPPSLALLDISLYWIACPFRLSHVTTNADAEACVAFLGAACFVEYVYAVTLLLAIFASVAA